MTGVSGSGKSTLVREVLYENLKAALSRRRRGTGAPAPRSRPMAATPSRAGRRSAARSRSTRRRSERRRAPAPPPTSASGTTCAGCSPRSPDAKMRGYTASRFSFNVSGGRCEECEGQGLKRIEMSFLPDVTRASARRAAGRRFNEETLAIRFRDRTIADVLAMSVDEAADFFSFHPRIHHSLKLLRDVGLGYLSLGPAEPDAERRARRSGSSWSRSWPRRGRGARRRGDGAPGGAQRRRHAAPASTCSTSRRSGCTWRTSSA